MTWPKKIYLPPYIPREHHSRACLSMTFSFLIYVLFYTFDIYRSYSLDQTNFCPSFLTLIFDPHFLPLFFTLIFDNLKDSTGDLTFETLITILTIENLNSDNHSYLTINCDTGQHSQFLRCLGVNFVIKNPTHGKWMKKWKS